MITLKTEAKRVGEMYYCIDSMGSILGVSPENTNKWQDTWRSEIGNVFKKPKDADNMAERLKIYQELKEFTRPYNKEEPNYFISYDIDVGVLFADEEVPNFIDPFKPYFGSVEDVERAIQAVGEERLKEYFL